MLWESPRATAAEPEKLGGTLHTPDEQTSTPQQSPSPSGSGMERGTAFSTSRQDGVYTILLVGNDDGTGNTDTIMVAKLGHRAPYSSTPLASRATRSSMSTLP